jgi:acyl-coenzyme A synthetase/AMP-(fatty) acid ligase
MSTLPAVDRPDGAARFLRPAGPVTKEQFLADAHRLAAVLPPVGYVLNLCRDRYLFTVTFVAAVLRGPVCLLSGDTSAPVLEALARDYPDCVSVTDAMASAQVTEPARAYPVPLIPAERQVAIVFTSGSTGSPTAHAKNWGALVARSRAAGERFGLTEASVTSVVATVTPAHMYGFEVSALLPLHAACASWCGQAFFPADVESALAAAPTPKVLVTTPLQLRALQGIAAQGLAACISATAPLDPALAAATEARWGAPMLEIFGATECGSVASRRTLDGEEWLPYPGVSLRRDDDAAIVYGEDAPPVPLADEVDILPDGRFRLLGRRADMVKLGGRRASLAGLNRILTGLEGVRDGIFVVPDDLDQRSTARLLAVVVAPNRSAPSILADLRDRMDPIFVPRRVVHVEALPRNALGKLPRQAVLDLLAQVDGR